MAQTLNIAVVLPLMPQGVEHPQFRVALASGVDVVLPLMPQGVEHNVDGGEFTRGEMWFFR